MPANQTMAPILIQTCRGLTLVIGFAAGRLLLMISLAAGMPTVTLGVPM